MKQIENAMWAYEYSGDASRWVHLFPFKLFLETNLNQYSLF